MKKVMIAITMATILATVVVAGKEFIDYSKISSIASVTKSKVEKVNGTPKIFINGADKITFVNRIYYVGDYDPSTGGVSKNPYKKGEWLAGVKKQMNKMKELGANTLILDIFWSDLVTVSKKPKDMETTINFTPLDEAMKYAKEKNIYIMINPKIDIFLAWWWAKENNFPGAIGLTEPGIYQNPCVPQEKNSDHSCIPKEICAKGDVRCCSKPKEELFCCNLDMPDPKRSEHIVSGISVGFTEHGEVKCKPWNNNPVYSKCTECETDSYGWKYTYPSMGADQFREDYSKYLTVLVNRYKDNPALIAWVFSLGPTGEDQYGPSYIILRAIYGNLMGQPRVDQISDYSDIMQSKFKTWIKGKYKSDKDLQQAWGDSTLNLKSIKLPDPKKVFKKGKEGPFPDDWFIGFWIDLDALTQQGRDMYDFREEIRNYQRDHFTKLFKDLDNNHILAYIGTNNDGIYNNKYIDAIVGANHVEYAVNRDSEKNFIALHGLLNKKHGKANIFALESTGEDGGMEGKSTNKEKQKDALLEAYKVMKCIGSHFGYVSTIDMPMPVWTASDFKVLKEIGYYNPGKNCICDFISPDFRLTFKTVSEIVRAVGLEDYYGCSRGGTVDTSKDQQYGQGRNQNLPSSLGKGKCGDGVCDGPENSTNCPDDCGNKQLRPSLGKGKCGDGVCDGPEDSTNCWVDCGNKQLPPSLGKGKCGDGVCDGPEDSTNCPVDCGNKQIPQNQKTVSGSGKCGDGVCDDFEKSSGMCKADCK